LCKLGETLEEINEQIISPLFVALIFRMLYKKGKGKKKSAKRKRGRFGCCVMSYQTN
jgi:hypothetical protein